MDSRKLHAGRRNRMSRASGAALVVLSLCAIAFAQGGKAEPKQIKFKPGTSSATIKDKIKNSEEAEYAFTAKAGQRVTIKLISVPGRSSVFNIESPNKMYMGLEYDANYDYQGKLPEGGDYLITVSRPTRSRGVSSYTLVVAIK